MGEVTLADDGIGEPMQYMFTLEEIKDIIRKLEDISMFMATLKGCNLSHLVTVDLPVAMDRLNSVLNVLKVADFDTEEAIKEYERDMEEARKKCEESSSRG